MLLVVMGIGLFRNFVNMSILLCTQLVLNCVGILICGLLLEKQIFGFSGYGDRVCNLFHHNDCNSVLDGKASKIFGFSWSEIGLGYFISSALLLAVNPSAQAVVSVLNWIAMIYGIWSVAYQWKKAKAWCVLCLITQFLIWSAGISAGCEYIHSSLLFTIDGAMLSSIVYGLSIVLIHLLAKGFLSDSQKINAEQQYRALKANSDVAKIMLSKRDFFSTEIGDSSILFGNPDAGMKITILSNPHCNPCARMHKRVEKLLNFGNGEICVQYILSSFNERLDESSRYLIAMYLNSNDAMRVFDDWYEKDKFRYETTVQNCKYDLYSNEVEEEMERHRLWRERTSLVETPTILVNGYKLPPEYDIEDLGMIVNHSN